MGQCIQKHVWVHQREKWRRRRGKRKEEEKQKRDQRGIVKSGAVCVAVLHCELCCLEGPNRETGTHSHKIVNNVCISKIAGMNESTGTISSHSVNVSTKLEDLSDAHSAVALKDDN